MRRLLRDHGLSLTMFLLFGLFLSGHAVAGFFVDRQDRRDHHQPERQFIQYLFSPEFGESVFENWESEFLQMASYVVLTAFLYQKGSAESRPLPEDKSKSQEFQEDRTEKDAANYSWWYQHSLSLSLAALFLVSWGLHAVCGWKAYDSDQQNHGDDPVSFGEFLVSGQFWFESLQNWQSEYLSIAALIVLSIFLRERGSPESKPLGASHWETGK